MQEAKIKYIDGRKWVCCPQCGRKAFPIMDETRIKDLVFQCKESRCKLNYKVNIR